MNQVFNRNLNAYVSRLPCPCLAPELAREMAGELTGVMVCEEEQVPLYREILQVGLPAHC